MKNIVVVMFSKDRPLQCQLAIDSYFNNCSDFLDYDINVIYYVSNSEFEKAYESLEGNYSGINFIKQQDFKNDLLKVVDGYKKVLWLVDDNVFTGPFNLKEISNLLDWDERCLGFSLRLGKNTDYCYSLDQDQSLPQFEYKFTGDYQEILEYDWTLAEHDFGYALEISSSVFRLSDLKEVLESGKYSNPNDFEWILFLYKSKFLHNKKNILCYRKSVAFCTPMNKVQNVNNNRHCNISDYSVEHLLELFENGYRVNPQIFIGYENNSCHEEVDFLEGINE